MTIEERLKEDEILSKGKYRCPQCLSSVLEKGKFCDECFYK